MHGLPNTMRIPHSRHANVGTAALRGIGASILIESAQAGWLVAQSKNQQGAHDVLIQGHPEYDEDTLQKESSRDGGHAASLYIDRQLGRHIIQNWFSYASSLVIKIPT